MFSEQNFHLVGIGGIGMSGLARILRAHGKDVRGSDMGDSPIIAKLREEQFEIAIPQKAENLSDDTEVVIHTLAAREDNPELVAARERGLRVLSYPEALGEITRDKKLIAIAGTHGKTTTTGLLISACLAAGADISCLIGTNLKELDNQNARVGESEWFVLEACEYQRAFLNLNPHIIVITNIEAEHLDYYKNLQDYEQAFIEFTQKLPENGVLVASSAEMNMEKMIDIAPHFFDTKDLLDGFNLNIWGEHNRRNAKLALVISELIGLDADTALEGVTSFTGGERRMELKGEFQGAQIYDDYAHHPTEIQATLRGVREEFPERRVIVVYQQHQLDRAAKMLSEIGESFWDADIVVIPNIYEVRDERESENKISGKDLVAETQKQGKEAHFTESFAKTVEWLQQNIKKDDMVIVMGAGDVFRITEELFSVKK